MLTQDQLKSNIHYCPDTGSFTRIRGDARHLGLITNNTDNGYLKFRFLGQTYKAHRLAFLYMTGHFPLNDVDHKNNLRHDNRWSNLRNATRGENSRNGCTRKNNTSGYKGVGKKGVRYHAQITKNRRIRFLGSFDTPEEAHEAYKKAALELHGEFANGG